MAQPLTSTVLVGRREELNRIDEGLVTLASRSRGGVMLITGEAGVGKTRLLEALQDRADDLQLPVYLGRCVEFGESVFPAAPIVDILEALAATLDPDERSRVFGSALDDLSNLVPGLGGTRDEAPRADELFAAVGDVLTRLCEIGPVVLVVEDLHWADRTTRDLVVFMAHRLRALPLLFVTSYRSDDLHRRHPLLPMLAELQRSTRPERIDLEPFDVETTAELVASVGGPELEPALVEELQRRSGGNAFFIEELLAAGAMDAAIPATLREIVTSRAAALDDETLALLRIASAAGTRIDEELLAEVSGRGREDVNASLRRLIDAQFLTNDADQFRFRHDLTREVFADELLPGERAALHLRFAEALEQRAPSRVAEIAHHWWLSGDQPAALRSAIAAGDAAQRSGAVAEAYLHYERALELWDRVPDDRRPADLGHPDLLFLAAEAAHLLQDFDRSNSLARQACEELADADADAVARAQAARRRGRWLWDSGAPGLEDTVVEALALVRDAPASREVVQVRAWAATVWMLSSRHEQSCEVALEAHEMARALGETAIEANALNTMAVSKARLGDGEALDDMRRALELAIVSNDPEEINRAHNNLTVLLRWHGRHEEAIAVAAEGNRFADAQGLRAVHRYLLVENAALALSDLGRWDQVETIAPDVTAHRALNFDVPAPTGLIPLACVMVRRGELDRARPILEHDHACQQSHYYGCGECDLFVAVVELALATGDELDRGLIEQGLSELMRADGRSVIGLMVPALRAEADLAVKAGHVGDQLALAQARARADRWLAVVDQCLEKYGTFTEFDSVPKAAVCRAEHGRAQGGNDPALWAEAVRLWEQVERPWERAYAKWRLAEALLLADATTNRAVAAEQLGEASQIAVTLGAKPLLADIEELAVRARIDLSGGEPEVDGDGAGEPVPFDLTPRELEVLELVAQGCSNGRIGEELFISTKTASVHVSNILRKLGAANRIEAAAIATSAAIVGRASATDPATGQT